MPSLQDAKLRQLEENLRNQVREEAARNLQEVRKESLGNLHDVASMFVQQLSRNKVAHATVQTYSPPPPPPKPEIGVQVRGCSLCGGGLHVRSRLVADIHYVPELKLQCPLLLLQVEPPPAAPPSILRSSSPPPQQPVSILRTGNSPPHHTTSTLRASSPPPQQGSSYLTSMRASSPSPSSRPQSLGGSPGPSPGPHQMTMTRTGLRAQQSEYTSVASEYTEDFDDDAGTVRSSLPPTGEYFGGDIVPHAYTNSVVCNRKMLARFAVNVLQSIRQRVTHLAPLPTDCSSTGRPASRATYRQTSRMSVAESIYEDDAEQYEDGDEEVAEEEGLVGRSQRSRGSRRVSLAASVPESVSYQPSRLTARAQPSTMSIAESIVSERAPSRSALRQVGAHAQSSANRHKAGLHLKLGKQCPWSCKRLPYVRTHQTY